MVKTEIKKALLAVVSNKSWAKAVPSSLKKAHNETIAFTLRSFFTPYTKMMLWT